MSSADYVTDRLTDDFVHLTNNAIQPPCEYRHWKGLLLTSWAGCSLDNAMACMVETQLFTDQVDKH